MIIKVAALPRALLLTICCIAVCQQPNEDLVPPPPPLVDKIVHADLPEISTKLRHEFTVTEFSCLTTIQSFPDELRSSLYAFLKTNRFANPGEKFNATDVIVNKSLPGRRLIIAGISGEMAFVCFEHGGYGKHNHLILFRRTDGHNLLPVANVLPNGLLSPDIPRIKFIINTKSYSYSHEA